MNEDTGLYGPVSSFLLCALPDGFLNGVSGRFSEAGWARDGFPKVGVAFGAGFRAAVWG